MATVNLIRYKKQSAGALKGVAEYVAQVEKTWDKTSTQRLVSGQNCTQQFACREFLATRSTWCKASPMWFYHYTQLVLHLVDVFEYLLIIRLHLHFRKKAVVLYIVAAQCVICGTRLPHPVPHSAGQSGAGKADPHQPGL